MSLLTHDGRSEGTCLSWLWGRCHRTYPLSVSTVPSSPSNILDNEMLVYVVNDSHLLLHVHRFKLSENVFLWLYYEQTVTSPLLNLKIDSLRWARLAVEFSVQMHYFELTLTFFYIGRNQTTISALGPSIFHSRFKKNDRFTACPALYRHADKFLMKTSQPSLQSKIDSVATFSFMPRIINVIITWVR